MLCQELHRSVDLGVLRHKRVVWRDLAEWFPLWQDTEASVLLHGVAPSEERYSLATTKLERLL